MTPEQLSSFVVGALEALSAEGEVTLDGPLPTSVAVLPSRGAADFASPVALSLAPAASIPARDLAGRLADRLDRVPGLAAVEVAGPGYLDLTLEPAELGRVAEQVLAAGPGYGVDGAPGGLPATGHGPPGPDGVPLPDVRLAHARAASLLRNAADLGLSHQGGDPSLLDEAAETALLRLLATFPTAVAGAARDVGRPVRHLRAVAEAFERLVVEVQVLPRGDAPTTAEHVARLLLVAATRTVLGNGLALLGVDAPERM